MTPGQRLGFELPTGVEHYYDKLNETLGSGPNPRFVRAMNQGVTEARFPPEVEAAIHKSIANLADRELVIQAYGKMAAEFDTFCRGPGKGLSFNAAFGQFHGEFAAKNGFDVITMPDVDLPEGPFAQLFNTGSRTIPGQDLFFVKFKGGCNGDLVHEDWTHALQGRLNYTLSPDAARTIFDGNLDSSSGRYVVKWMNARSSHRGAWGVFMDGRGFAPGGGGAFTAHGTSPVQCLMQSVHANANAPAPR